MTRTKKEIDEEYRRKNAKKISENSKRYRLKRKREIFQLLGNKCANPFNLPHPDWCNDPKILQIDHIRGNGYKKRKACGCNPYKIYNEILREIMIGSKDYQLLCPNCNWLKRIKNKEFIRGIN